MDMTGERRIPAPRQKVWDALNDPAVLQKAIPGCKSLEKLSDTEMKATAGIRIGPISASFAGKVQLLDLDPPNGYRIQGEGQGGVAGFANGGAVVTLSDDAGSGTLLRYDVKAQVGGKIAQLGTRLIDATAKSMADQFFDRFSAEMAPPVAAEPLPPVAAPAGAAAPHPHEYGADGLLTGLVEAAQATHPGKNAPAIVNLLSMIPEQPYGFPRIFWVGSFICLLIFLLIFGSYL